MTGATGILRLPGYSRFMYEEEAASAVGGAYLDTSCTISSAVVPGSFCSVPHADFANPAHTAIGAMKTSPKK